MRKALIVVAILLVVAVCAGTVEAKEVEICDFCGKSGVGYFFDLKYCVIGGGGASKDFCSKKCVAAYFSGYTPADTRVEAQIRVPAATVCNDKSHLALSQNRKQGVPVVVAPPPPPLPCQCWWCRLTRWLGFKGVKE